MAFTKEQQAAYDAITLGRNVFLTGNAGTGKSYVLEQAINHMDKNGHNYVAAAPTGIAAFNIGGQTLHSILKIKPQILMGNPSSTSINNLRDLFTNDGTLIVDEISMCRLDLFEYLIKTIEAVEKANKVHIQLILVGDFFQLPPIVSRSESKTYYARFNGIYPFESGMWGQLKMQTIVLHEQVRQKADNKADEYFIEALNHLRFNDEYAYNAIKYLNDQCLHKNDDPNATYLCGFRRSADSINRKKLDELPTREVEFEGIRKGKIKPSEIPTGEKIDLKVGAKVMLVKNVNVGDAATPDYVYNGQQGIITDIYDDDTKAPQPSWFNSQEPAKWDKLDRKKENGVMVHFFANSMHDERDEFITWEKWDKEEYYTDAHGKIKKHVCGSFVQIPLKLAYAITIHKAQGQTINGTAILLNEIFAPGQLYVGLSRVTKLKDLVLQSQLLPQNAIPNLKVVEFYKNIDPQVANTKIAYNRQYLMGQLAQNVNKLTDDQVVKLLNYIKLL